MTAGFEWQEQSSQASCLFAYCHEWDGEVHGANDAVLQLGFDPSQWKAAEVSQKHSYLYDWHLFCGRVEFVTDNGREILSIALASCSWALALILMLISLE